MAASSAGSSRRKPISCASRWCFAAALILILVARQGRLLLERAVRETTLRVNLTRYLPRELAPILSDRAFDALRAGKRITATLLFVDIRDSSTPSARTWTGRGLPIFISSFRRRVVQGGGPAWGHDRQVRRRRRADPVRRARGQARRRRPGARLRPHAARPRRALERQARVRAALADRHRHPYRRNVLRRGRRRGPARIHRAGRDRQHRGADRTGHQGGRLRLPRLAGRGDGRRARTACWSEVECRAAARRHPQDRADGAEKRADEGSRRTREGLKLPSCSRRSASAAASARARTRWSAA